MNIDNSRAQILINRNQLCSLYALLGHFKQAKNHCDANGYTEAEYNCHNSLKSVKKEIARLVVLQKALKADVAAGLQRQRMLADFKKRSEARRKVTAAKWSAEDSAARLIAMERAGGML